MGRHRRLNALRSLIAVIACAGCNAVFDIGSTRGPDGDGDGAGDGADNCAIVANADQRDTDGDGLGDRCDPCDGLQSGQDSDGDGFDDLCDPCPMGSNHDEDRDGALDGCDVCPGELDDQADADHDGVGDACDAAPDVVNRRIMFDGFGPPGAGWRAWFKAWTSTDDSYAPVTGGDSVGAWNPAARVTDRGWWIEVAVVTPPVPDDYYGLFIRSVPGGFQQSECLLEHNNGAWRANYDPDTSITPGEITRFRFFAHSVGAQCTIDGVAVPTLALAADEPSFVPALATGLGTKFLWIDVVEGP